MVSNRLGAGHAPVYLGIARMTVNGEWFSKLQSTYYALYSSVNLAAISVKCPCKLGRMQITYQIGNWKRQNNLAVLDKIEQVVR